MLFKRRPVSLAMPLASKPNDVVERQGLAGWWLSQGEAGRQEEDAGC
jgi:hypothetical protein